MRTWDTPELLLSLQEKVGQFDLNHLNFLMAEHYLPIFAKLVKPGGYLITSEIFNLGLEEDAEVKRLNTAQILTNFNWLVLQSSGGLYLAKLRN
jgi:hypothetical protein